MKSIGKKNISGAMKKYCLHFAIFILTCNAVFGEIKNGYEKDIFGMKESLKKLSSILIENKELPLDQRRKIESSIETLVNHIVYYELTENLLNQFRIIAPGLCHEIDTIRDRMGRAVNVYVKFIPTNATEVKAWGTTCVGQVENDKDAYRSEYGEFTVSVKIWTVTDALLVLSHELGHVKYQVPNLASYVEFHKDRYNRSMEHPNYIGHDPGDLSGKSAIQYEKIFKKEYAYFLKMTNERIQNPLVLIGKIRKSLSHTKIIL